MNQYEVSPELLQRLADPNEPDDVALCELLDEIPTRQVLSPHHQRTTAAVPQTGMKKPKPKRKPPAKIQPWEQRHAECVRRREGIR